jgi:hypothetical protein
VAQVVVCLPSKLKTQSSTSSTAKKSVCVCVLVLKGLGGWEQVVERVNLIKIHRMHVQSYHNESPYTTHTW